MLSFAILVGSVVLSNVVNGPGVETSAGVSLTIDVVVSFPFAVVAGVVVLPSVVVVVLPSVVMVVVTFPVKIVVEVVVVIFLAVVVDVVSPGAGQTTCTNQATRLIKTRQRKNVFRNHQASTRCEQLTLSFSLVRLPSHKGSVPSSAHPKPQPETPETLAK